MSAELLPARYGATLSLTMSNPGSHNWLDPDIYAAAIEALDIAEGDAGIKCVVLGGTDEMFCGGRDPQLLLAKRQSDSSALSQEIDLLGAWVTLINSCGKVVIAAVEGLASGGGCGLALACDLIVASRDARFELPGVAWGLTPEGGASWLLNRSMPSQLGLELMLTGAPIAAERLAQAGVINRLVLPGQARNAAIQWADEIGNHPAATLIRLKELAGLGRTQTLAQQLLSERDFLMNSLRQH
jgi:enoyl-CoA hydratase/carnithine racemase